MTTKFRRWVVGLCTFGAIFTGVWALVAGAAGDVPETLLHGLFACSFATGGFLLFGKNFHPLPWRTLGACVFVAVCVYVGLRLQDGLWVPRSSGQVVMAGLVGGYIALKGLPGNFVNPGEPPVGASREAAETPDGYPDRP